MSAFAFSWATYIMRSFLNCTFFLLVFSFLGEVYPFATLPKERKGQNVVPNNETIKLLLLVKYGYVW